MANDINTMPHNQEAEMALLGCLLMDNEIAADIVDKLHEDDFYTERHQVILRAMQRVFNERKPVDPVTPGRSVRVGPLPAVRCIPYWDGDRRSAILSPPVVHPISLWAHKKVLPVIIKWI